MNTALSRSTGLLLSCLLAAACTDTTLYSSHEPMHPITDYVYLKAEATGSIDRIELWLQRFEVVADDTGKYDEVAETTKYMVRVCDPASYVSSLKCVYRQAFSGHHKIIEFEARAFYRNGRERSETYRFASGRFIDANLPIPIRATGAPVESLDIVIVPDPDLFGDVNGFRYFFDDMIDGMFFDYSALRNSRNLYNFYYTMQPGSYTSTAQGCVFTLPQNIADIEAVADSVLFAHLAQLRDCTFNVNFSSEHWYGKSLVHEAGHSLFGLRDEYAGANFGEYGPQECGPKTIFASESDCQMEASAIGLPANWCTQVNDSAFNIWRIDPVGADGSLMGDSQHFAWSRFWNASVRRIEWRHEQCRSGDCMQACQPPGVEDYTIPPEDIPSHADRARAAGPARRPFSLEDAFAAPYLALTVELAEDGTTIADPVLVLGPRRIAHSANGRLRVLAIDTGDEGEAETIVADYLLADPRSRLMHTGTMGRLTTRHPADSGETRIFIPLSLEIDKTRIESLQPGGDDTVITYANFDPRGLARQACEGEGDGERMPRFPECEDIVRAGIVPVPVFEFRHP